MGKIYSQSFTVDDPIEDYLRLFDAKSDRVLLPSLSAGSFSVDNFRNKIDLNTLHPWGHKLFFRKQESRLHSTFEDSTEKYSVEIHRVKPLETVYRISRMYGITEEQLLEWNNLDDNTLYIGQELVVEELKPVKATQTQISSQQETKWTFKYYSPVSKTTYNNNFPIGQNDGALWQGRGFNTVLSAGTYVSYGPFRASIRPNFIHSENKDFTLSRWPSPVGISEYGYEFSMIDYPQRFGNEAITKIDPGQSWFRGDYHEFSAGISTSSMRLGPAIYNPVILSNNAPGFLHFFIETNKPLQTGIGNFEGKVFWGNLNESNYFDNDGSNNRQLINGFTFSYSPKYIEGLYIGLARVFVKPTGNNGLSFGDYFLAFRPMEGGESDTANQLQMASLFGRWKVPDYGFEFYAEWGRNTPANSFRDLLIQPEYSRAYTMGFLKRFILAPDQWLTLNFELTQIERPRSVEFRKSEPFYRSNAVPQGYTHQGQILGAGIGPGSNSQKVHVKYYWKHGLFGVSFNRILNDNTRLYENYMVIGQRPWGIRNPRIANEVEFRYGLNAIAFLHDNIELQFDVYRTRFFQHEHGVLPFETPNVYNTNLQVTFRYQLGNFLR